MMIRFQPAFGSLLVATLTLAVSAATLAQPPAAPAPKTTETPDGVKVVTFAPPPAIQKPAETLNGWPLLAHETFAGDALSRWEFADPKAWKIEANEGQPTVIHQFQQSKVQTPVRSPFNRSLIKDLVVTDCVLDVHLQSTARDYAHRSLCLFFGYQNPSHMYYVHLGQKMDDNANQIFIVNDAPRTKISAKTNPGTPWDHAWHHARVVRNAETGDIAIYFDDMQNPAMTAQDKTFTWGQVGVGSFDDTGRFSDLTVYGKRKQ